MNHTGRILLVGRHFWPLACFDSSGFLVQLATDLHRAEDRSGHRVEVLTPRYSASCPERFVYREMVVHRPAMAPRSDWSMGRYVRHLTTWLKTNIQSFDIVVCDSIREEALAVVEAAAGSAAKIVLISSQYGSQSDPAWWQSSRLARRCAGAANLAHCVVVKDAQSERLLLGKGIAAEKIQRIPIGFTGSIGLPNELTLGILDEADDRKPSGEKTIARRRLGNINTDLRTMPDTPVVVCCGRFQRDSGMDLLARSARLLIARYPDLRIWFIGDGPNRHSMHDFVRGDGVRNSISMPGSFNDLSDVYTAADVYVQADEDGLDSFLPTAVSAALPIVAIDTPAVRSVLGMNRSAIGNASIGNEKIGNGPNLARLFSGATTKSLRAGLREILDDLPAGRAKAIELKRHLLRTRPQSQVIESYLDLFQRLKRSSDSPKRSNRSSNSSIEAAS
ncbi:Glycosyl transferases group 1 [Novipirellula aureliae]|uniref:Glycosyl transferases group 1 n=1 Tax=Novipirellula aureliae TaxID=2527966 RepID=A0A5C6DL94_9BACT|nr:glycosyltransferase family 4 protein [Novipirellula aureliae]TWU35679.1 Glycosyl transferases group 1 [Novipirellula aureliae]